MANGFMGKMLWVDLEKGTFSEESTDEKLAREYIGGYGLGARILYERMKPGVDALGPENILGFITGPLAGTPSHGGARYTVVTKSPLTGGWGDANSGGYFGPQLRFTGYDAVFFTGIAPKPVYLFIDNGVAELRDASHLWGKECYVTEDLVREELGKDVLVASVGPPGENLSLISGIVNDQGRLAARSGVGAVMGSKKLKAFAVRGKLTVPLADEAKANELRTNAVLRKDGLSEMGTCSIVVPLVMGGDSPIKNWGGSWERDFPHPERIGGEAVLEKQERKYACYKCQVACGGKMKEGTGEYKYPAGAKKPEYETLCMFGSIALNDNLDSIIAANDICNRYGLDTISAGAVVAFAIECYENGILTKEDTDGLELTWGNHQSIVALTDKIAKREGIGDILADGVKVAAERIGKGSEEYAMHMRGQEFGAHNPKYGSNWALAYKADATPSRHPQGPGRPVPGMPAPLFDKTKQHDMQPAYKIQNNIMHVIQSLGLCKLAYWAMPDAQTQLDLLNAVTGWGMTFDEFFLAGERIANIRHLFCLREGVNILQQRYPDRMAGRPPLEEGPMKGVSFDEDRIMSEYLEVMDWDPVTTMPSKKKLQELGMQDINVAF